MQDCSVLGDIVAQNPGSIDASLERYERQRKPDVLALGTMDHQVCTRAQACLIVQTIEESIVCCWICCRQHDAMRCGVV